ncbi:hypothetical protein GIB67_005942 [Kingdonia uniflora]|uniref:Uncharacterized protein n=1 Tax=Kingdonia uniflora TaxID=39325 RepID=A0A7J7MC17_9MAGN|nr:hypothetical protein GIB67_005942 [Kingdonia uniflora]
MAEEENELQRVECLRGRLYAERLALKAANKNADLMEKRKPEMEEENNRWEIVDSDNQKYWTRENSNSAGSFYSCNSNKDLCLIENDEDDNNLSEESTTYEFRYNFKHFSLLRDLDSSRKKGKTIVMPFVPASCLPDLRRSSRTRPWGPFTELESRYETVIPLWIKLLNDQSSIELKGYRIASSIGKSMHCDKATEEKKRLFCESLCRATTLTGFTYGNCILGFGIQIYGVMFSSILQKRLPVEAGINIVCDHRE